MKLTKKNQIYLIRVNRNTAMIAIFKFLKIREPLFVFSSIGIKLAPYGICFKPERNIHSAYFPTIAKTKL